MSRAEQHHTQTRTMPRDWPHSPIKYEAKCSCGWTQNGFHTENQAENAADNHVIAVVRAEP